MALKDFPALEKAFNELSAEKEAIQARSAPLRAQRDAIIAQIQPLEDQARELAAQVREIEGTRLAEICNEMGAIARGTGGRSLSQGPTPEDLAAEAAAASDG